MPFYTIYHLFPGPVLTAFQHVGGLTPRVWYRRRVRVLMTRQRYAAWREYIRRREAALLRNGHVIRG